MNCRKVHFEFFSAAGIARQQGYHSRRSMHNCRNRPGGRSLHQGDRKMPIRRNNCQLAHTMRQAIRRLRRVTRSLQSCLRNYRNRQKGRGLRGHHSSLRLSQIGLPVTAERVVELP
ncbi:MAG: hypothetical protein GXP26_01410 [Planctomycetes bacterium]|nr:hypothetical protein [Planctomycetota bacterium]